LEPNSGLNLEPDSERIVFINALVEPGERLILIASQGINYSEILL
jgi:hypothetical protein